jgi:PKHD-type hydroxylase
MAFQLLRPALTGQLAFDGFLNADECQAIVEGGRRSLCLAPGRTEDPRTSLRQSEIAWLTPDGEHRWLFDRVTQCVNDINRNWFGYHLIGFEGIQFTKYSHAEGKPGDHYGAHKDMRLLADGTVRKLSFTIQLSEPESYEGRDVVLYDSFTDYAALSRARGSISFFPSYAIHEVTPVSRGTRHSLVGWATGPAFV